MLFGSSKKLNTSSTPLFTVIVFTTILRGLLTCLCVLEDYLNSGFLLGGILLNELVALGLTAGEARVYMSLLRLGPSKVGAVVRESRVSYSKVYDVLERRSEERRVGKECRSRWWP